LDSLCKRPAYIPDNIALDQACSTFYVVRAASAKFGLHAGNMKFNTQNEK
jgi:hypothetical protein